MAQLNEEIARQQRNQAVLDPRAARLAQSLARVPEGMAQQRVDLEAQVKALIGRIEALEAEISEPTHFHVFNDDNSTISAKYHGSGLHNQEDAAKRAGPGERRRIVLQQRLRQQRLRQQRLRIRPEADGRYIFATNAPSPIATLATGGRVFVLVLMPWQDEDIRTEILERTEGFEVEQGQVKAQPWGAWH